jgi:hypothetical protein
MTRDEQVEIIWRSVKDQQSFCQEMGVDPKIYCAVMVELAEHLMSVGAKLAKSDSTVHTGTGSVH